jgi:hypothetical protein
MEGDCMAHSAPLTASAPALTREWPEVRVTAVPWFIWSAVLAVTSTTVGLYWDISWHIGIGRDTFWTPAHLAIQFGAVLTGLSCAYLILYTTFAGDASAQGASVRVLGFRGPLGAFIASWGGFCMLTSAPFDNWWHNSFGLDVKILSPPHVVLIVGIFTMGLGGLLLSVSQMNLSSGEAKRKLTWLLLYVGSLLLSLLVMLGYEYIGDQTLMHSAIFYRVLGMAAPLVLVGVGRASGHRWGATILATMYTVMWIAAEWIFPLFPAQAKLGPVFTPITHMIPLGFPALLLPGALVVDLALNRFSTRSKALQAVLAGSGFLVLSLLANWPFASFLVTPAARNWVFGMNYFGYNVPPSEYHLAWEFQAYEKTRPEFWTGMATALVVTALSVRTGMLWGDWMRRMHR